MASPGLSLELSNNGPLIPRRKGRPASTVVFDSPSFRPPSSDAQTQVPPHLEITISQYKQFQALYSTPTTPSTSDIYFQYTSQTKDSTDNTSNNNNNVNSRASQLPKKLEFLEQQCEIDFDQLVFKNKLGEGAFGEVWRGSLWDLDVAIKRLKGNFLRASPLEELADEVALLK